MELCLLFRTSYFDHRYFVRSISKAIMPANTFATKAAAISSKTTARPTRAETPPSSIPAYNIGITITRG